jgi:hypothetical protein
MTDQEVRDLLQEFAAPLSPYVTSPARKASAEMLVRVLWMAMITDREFEEQTWKTLKTRGKPGRRSTGFDPDVLLRENEASSQC